MSERRARRVLWDAAAYCSVRAKREAMSYGVRPCYLQAMRLLLSIRDRIIPPPLPRRQK